MQGSWQEGLDAGSLPPAVCSLCQIHRTRVSSHSSKATCLYNCQPTLVREACATADVQRHQSCICIAAARQAAACGAAAAAALAGGSAQAAAALLGQQVQRSIAQQGAAAQAQRPGGGKGVAWSVGRAEHTGKDPPGSNDHPPAALLQGEQRRAPCSATEHGARPHFPHATAHAAGHQASPEVRHCSNVLHRCIVRPISVEHELLQAPHACQRRRDPRVGGARRAVVPGGRWPAAGGSAAVAALQRGGNARQAEVALSAPHGRQLGQARGRQAVWFPA